MARLAPFEGEVVLPEKISSVTLPISFPPLRVKDLSADPRILTVMKLGTGQVLEKSADELSIGEQQKLAISLALSQEADLYVLDEPFANLDTESRDIALNLIFEKTRRRALIVVMHGSEEHHKRFDRVIKIDCAPSPNTNSEPALLGCDAAGPGGYQDFPNAILKEQETRGPSGPGGTNLELVDAKATSY